MPLEAVVPVDTSVASTAHREQHGGLTTRTQHLRAGGDLEAAVASRAASDTATATPSPATADHRQRVAAVRARESRALGATTEPSSSPARLRPSDATPANAWGRTRASGRVRLPCLGQHGRHVGDARRCRGNCAPSSTPQRRRDPRPRPVEVVGDICDHSRRPPSTSSSWYRCSVEYRSAQLPAAGARSPGEPRRPGRCGRSSPRSDRRRGGRPSRPCGGAAPACSRDPRGPARSGSLAPLICRQLQRRVGLLRDRRSRRVAPHRLQRPGLRPPTRPSESAAPGA
jgi:hypothetical protein